jgi:hypothetical protein
MLDVVIFAESNDVKFTQLIDVEFKNLYTVSLAKLSLCLPVNIFIYIDLFVKIKLNKYLNNVITDIPLLLYAFESLRIDEILYFLKKFIIEKEIFLSFS